MRTVVHGIRGRLVRKLVEDHLPSGQSAFTWDGNDDAAYAVAAGVHFCRMVTGSEEAPEKIVLLRAASPARRTSRRACACSSDGTVQGMFVISVGRRHMTSGFDSAVEQLQHQLQTEIAA